MTGYEFFTCLSLSVGFSVMGILAYGFTAWAIGRQYDVRPRKRRR